MCVHRPCEHLVFCWLSRQPGGPSWLHVVVMAVYYNVVFVLLYLEHHTHLAVVV